MAFVETSTNFTGAGAGLWVAIYPNDTYRIVISNLGVSQSYINGEIGAGTIIIETNPVPYTSYYTETVYGPFYYSRFLWIGIALLGVVIGIYTYLHRRTILQELKD